jgi:hypothetical protein
MLILHHQSGAAIGNVNGSAPTLPMINNLAPS